MRCDAPPNTLRELGDEVIARVDGDELAVLALDVDRVTAQSILSRLRENSTAFDQGDRSWKLSTSTGVAMYE